MTRLITRDGLLFLGSAVLLALARLSLVVFPFRTVLSIVHRACTTPTSLRGPVSAVDIERVRWAVSRASRGVPGARHCLTQALVAKILLRGKGRPVDLRIGVAKDE